MYQLSPGIQIKEFDISAYIPGVSSSVGAIGGVFSWGPVEARTLVSDVNTLATRFGTPNDDNYETFMIASNFLAYSNALYVSRAADANTYNAITGSGASPVQIKNINDFEVKKNSIDANTTFIAKYPSALGNSLRVSVCASVEAFSSTPTTDVNSTIEVEFAPGANTAVINLTDSTGNTSAAIASLTNYVGNFDIGDWLTVNTSTNTTQYVKISNIGGPIAGTDPGDAKVTINLVNRYTLAETTTLTSLTRNWEYFQLFDRAPGTSDFVSSRGGSGDEMHIVIVDRQGVFSGQPNQVLEIFSNVSRATDAKAENGSTAFYKDALNDSSMYVWAGSDISGVASGSASGITPISVEVYTQNFTGGTASSSESTISLTYLANAYDQFKSKEDVDVSLIIAGKAVGGIHGEGLANYIIDNIAEVRRDCVVTISPALSDVVTANFEEVDNLIEFRRALRYSGRGFMTTAYKYQFDRYNNKNRWVAGCGDDAGLMARTDFDRDPWWSPAGENRGMYKNIIRLAFSPNQAHSDALYKEDINSVINLVGAGVILYGDKTLLGKPSAFDRINVRRLFDVLEKAISKYARALLFEFNDQYTRARFRNTVEPYLRDVMSRRGITRFKVVCDETNNTPVVIDRNEFIGSIFVVPNKSINFIELQFTAVANAVSFDYAIGEVLGQQI